MFAQLRWVNSGFFSIRPAEQYWLLHFYKLIMSVSWLESGYMVKYSVSSLKISSIGIYLGLRLYFDIYLSSRHNTYKINCFKTIPSLFFVTWVVVSPPSRWQVGSTWGHQLICTSWSCISETSRTSIERKLVVAKATNIHRPFPLWQIQVLLPPFLIAQRLLTDSYQPSFANIYCI